MAGLASTSTQLTVLPPQVGPLDLAWCDEMLAINFELVLAQCGGIGVGDVVML